MESIGRLDISAPERSLSVFCTRPAHGAANDKNMPHRDQRWTEGGRLFDAGDFFAAHEVWEALWRATPGPERGFVKGLIQAAVCVHHARRGNAKGSRKLFDSGRAWMARCDAPAFGVDVARFWAAMASALKYDGDPLAVALDASRLPVLGLDGPERAGLS